MTMFKIPIDKDHLVNRWKEYEQWWSDRSMDENEPDCHIDILPDGSDNVTDVVRFHMLAQQNQTSHRKLLESMIFAIFVVVTC